jgi:hypothetical protein
MEQRLGRIIELSRSLQEGNEFVPGTDAQVIKDTLRVYGSAFGLMIFAFCIVRKRYPRLYIVRRWAPKVQCELAQQDYGFLSWMWKVYGPTDEEILDQCGMDSLCFLRVIRFGLKVSSVGIFNSIWLLPVYATAEESDETANVQDPVEEVTTSNLPSMSPRFIGTVVGAYFVFLYSMYLILHEFEWYTKHRHAFLSKPKPRNYAIYVTGIPKEYRSSRLLLDYFRSCFPRGTVLEAHVAMDIPNLCKQVAYRDVLVAKLEHAMAVKQLLGYSPTHLTLKGKVDSISAYGIELKQLNSSISNAITKIEEAHASLRGTTELAENPQASTNAEHLIGLSLRKSEELEEMEPLTPSTHRPAFESGSFQLFPSFDSLESQTFDPSMLLRTRKRTFRERLAIFNMPEDIAEREKASESDHDDSILHPEQDEQEQATSVHISHKPKPETTNCCGEKCSFRETLNGAIRILHNEEGEDSVDEIHDCDLPISMSDNTPGVTVSPMIHYECSSTEGRYCDGTDLESCGERQLLESEDADTLIFVKCIGLSKGHTTSTGDTSLESDTQIRPATDAQHHGLLNSASFGGSGRIIKKLGNSGRVVRELVKSGQIVKILTGSSTDTIAREVGNAIKEVNVDNLKLVTDKGIRTLKRSGAKGIKQVTNVGTQAINEVVHTAKDIIIRNEDGNPRDAGFVVFTKLSTTQAALQMIHNSKPYVMAVEEAPEPADVFWDNVGKSHKSRLLGRLLSFALSAVLCFFWTIPVSVISGFSEIDTLKTSIPFLARMVETYPWLEAVLSQLAPLLLIGLNLLLPYILREFAKVEGHIASSALEASLFEKLSVFMIIQTFFVSAISGGVYAELTQIMENPSSIVDLLANSLPTRGTYFVQLVLVTTFLGQGLELLRVIPLSVAFIRSKIGPNLTEKERSKPYREFLRPLSDPRDFEHAQVFANLVLYFMVIFVYAIISPIINYFIAFCFIAMGSGYRYQFISNYPSTPDSGGKLWYGFITICLSCMVIAQLTLVGLLALKKATYALPCMAPLIAITIGFTLYLRGKHSYVTKHLPTLDCLHIDRQNCNEGDFDFVERKYVQPALLAQDKHPQVEDFDNHKPRHCCC